MTLKRRKVPTTTATNQPQATNWTSAMPITQPISIKRVGLKPTRESSLYWILLLMRNRMIILWIGNDRKHSRRF